MTVRQRACNTLAAKPDRWNGLSTGASILSRALAEIIDRQMATKAEVEAHENNLRRDIEALRLEMKRDIAETNARIAESKAELIRWVVGAGFLQTTLIIGVLMKMGGMV